MECLARFHLAAARFAATPAEAPWFAIADQRPSPSLAERIAQLDAWTTSRRNFVRQALQRSPHSEFSGRGLQILQHFERLAPRLRMELAAACSRHCRLQPCIRDVWHDHLLFTGDLIHGPHIDPEDWPDFLGEYYRDASGDLMIAYAGRR